MLTTSTFLPYAQRPGEKCGLVPAGPWLGRSRFYLQLLSQWNRAASFPASRLPGRIMRLAHRSVASRRRAAAQLSAGTSRPETLEGLSAKEQKKEIHEGPRRTTKGHEGVGESSGGIRQRLGREKRFSTKGDKGSVKGAKDEFAKGFFSFHGDWKRLERDP